jgi:hypothetical protein
VGRFSQLSAEAGRLAAARDGIDLGNIDWAVPFGLVRFRKETNPYTHLVPPEKGLFWMQSAPPPLDLEGFEIQTGILVDYVILFGRLLPAGAVELQPWPWRAVDIRAAEWASFQTVLNNRYIFIKASPLGLWELWSRRSSSPGKSLSSCPG